jgi:tRNA uridine 5-carboxymethylaminomethyl modification enzyme
MFKLAARPQLDFSDVRKFPGVKEFIAKNNIDIEIVEQTEIHVKYSGYIEKEKNSADKLLRLENIKIPPNFNYQKIKSISFEAREKLTKIQPTTISQASRISGVSPSDVSVLLVYMGR